MFTGEIQRSRSKRPLVIGLISFIVIVSLILVVPMPRTVKSSFVLAPTSTVELAAPREGTIGEVSSTSGSVVAKGSLIAKYSVVDEEVKIAALEKELVSLEKALRAPAPRSLVAAVKAAEKLVAAAKKAAKGKKTAALAAAEKKQKAAIAALEKATGGVSQEELEKQVATTKEALAAAKAMVGMSSILAPAAGVLTLIGLEKGKTISKDAKIAMVEDTVRLKAIVKVPTGEEVLKGQGVELMLPSGPKRVLFDADAKAGIAEAEFENAKGEFTVGAQGDAHIEGTQRSLVSN